MKLTLRLGNALAFGGILAAGATLPTYFERNAGQAPSRAEFVVRGAGYSALLSTGGAELSLKHGAQVKLRWKGANRAPAMEGLSLLEARSNYFIGSDPALWKRDIRQYGKVLYRGVYPGIDVVFYANGSGLESDFVVAPGADPAKIRMTFDGIRAVRLEASGDLVLDTPEGAIRDELKEGLS